MTRLSLRPSGTSPSTMRRARPSTMAVLPTPGSPISTGLFLVRRDSTWMTRRISSSRPMTGSSLPAAGRLGQVAPVLLEGLVLLLGVLAGHPVAAPDLGQGGQQVLVVHLEAVGQGQQQVLGRQVLVVQLAPGLVGRVEHRGQVAAHAGLAAVGLVQPVDRGLGLGAQLVGRLANLGQDGQDDPFVLAQQGHQQVVGRDLGVAVGPGRFDGLVQRLLGLERPTVGVEGQGSDLQTSGSSVHRRVLPGASLRKVDSQCIKFVGHRKGRAPRKTAAKLRALSDSRPDRVGSVVRDPVSQPTSHRDPAKEGH